MHTSPKATPHRAEREIRWQAALEKAKQQAVQDQLAEKLGEEARRWREAAALGEYCDALERRLAELDSAQEEADPAAPDAGCSGHVVTCRRSILVVGLLGLGQLASGGLLEAGVADQGSSTSICVCA
ncbi:hypothetical protein J7E88_01530 [Streptomyces sp. ISL-10]|uniref:hypothetical protein n=1 Tax=Streptomyces sp. ISL-10 TaxID=2819172 RepID=UPI001BE97869|nr:hypothetical protein [Streptomyces sp. ISL-10]MBT2364046.1 hypothetical protein [Streptomyces sp. ISL-10]